MKRNRLERKRFVYRTRDASLFHLRFGIRPKKPKPLPGTDTLLAHLQYEQWARDALESRTEALANFLVARPRLKLEYEAFLKSDYDPDDETAAIKQWMVDANERAAPAIRQKEHLSLVVNNDAPRPPEPSPTPPTSLSGSGGHAA